MPAPASAGGVAHAEQVLWEDVVYGAAEGTLLAVLSVLTVWQALDALGWTSGTAGKLGVALLAVVANPIAPMIGHMGLHAAIDADGYQLPPYSVSPEAPRTVRPAA